MALLTQRLSALSNNPTEVIKEFLHNSRYKGRREGKRSQQTVTAFANGSVTLLSHNRIRGNYLVVRHNETYQTVYQHLAKKSVLVKHGSKISAGQILAELDSPFPHASSFELWKNGTPVDPTPYQNGAISMCSSRTEEETGSFIYIIQKGDTLQKIARKELGDVNLCHVLLELNHLEEDSDLLPGQILRLPGYKNFYPYVIRRGDTLWSIAKKRMGKGRYFTELALFNGLDPYRAVYPGQMIQIPLLPSRQTFDQ